MKIKRLVFIASVTAMMFLFGCADFCRTYKTERYHLKTKSLARLPLQVEIDSLSLHTALSVCEYQHGYARTIPGVDTTFVYGFNVDNSRISFKSDAKSWVSGYAISTPGNAYMAGTTTFYSTTHNIPARNVVMGKSNPDDTGLLAIMSDPDVPKNIKFVGQSAYLYPDVDKREPVSVDTFTRYRIKHSNSWFYFKSGTTAATADSMNLSLFLSPLTDEMAKAKGKSIFRKEEGSAVLLYHSPIAEIYDPAKTIVNRQRAGNPIFDNPESKGKIVISFTGTTKLNFPPGIFLTIPAVITFCTSPLLGIPFMAYTAEIPVKASVYNSNGELIKEYHNTGKKTGYAAYYWGYHYNVIRQQTILPTGGIFGQDVIRDAFSKALVAAIDNVLQDVVNDSKSIEEKL